MYSTMAYNQQGEGFKQLAQAFFPLKELP